MASDNQPDRSQTTDGNTADGPFIPAQTVEGIRMSDELNPTTTDSPPPIPHLPASQHIRARVAFIRFCKKYGLDPTENPLRSHFINRDTENQWLLWSAAWMEALNV